MKKEEKHGGISSRAVERRTGKSWAEWVTLLDGEGAAKSSHKEIAILLQSRYGLDGWWAQMITVGYEQARGLRQKYQKGSGFSASKSRVLNAPLDRVFLACTNPVERGRWLEEQGIEVRKVNPGKSVRLTWSDRKSLVVISVYSKGESRTQTAIQHEKLPQAEAVETMKTFWADALEKLARLVEQSS